MGLVIHPLASLLHSAYYVNDFENFYFISPIQPMFKCFVISKLGGISLQQLALTVDLGLCKSLSSDINDSIIWELLEYDCMLIV